MSFKCADGMLCRIAEMHIRGDKLVAQTPILCDDPSILCDGFIIQDFQVYYMAERLEAALDGVDASR